MNSRVLANTGLIRLVVDKYHVKTPDTVIMADFNERLDRGDWTARERRRVIQYAIAYHHRNQQFYQDVMGGLW